MSIVYYRMLVKLKDFIFFLFFLKTTIRSIMLYDIEC